MAVLSILNRPFTPLYNGLEKWIRSIAKDVPEETDWEDSTKGSWYIQIKHLSVNIYSMNIKNAVSQVSSSTSTCD
jgi:hypothetical protein